MRKIMCSSVMWVLCVLIVMWKGPNVFWYSNSIILSCTSIGIGLEVVIGVLTLSSTISGD